MRLVTNHNSLRHIESYACISTLCRLKKYEKKKYNNREIIVKIHVKKF